MEYRQDAGYYKNNILTAQIYLQKSNQQIAELIRKFLRVEYTLFHITEKLYRSIRFECANNINRLLEESNDDSLYKKNKYELSLYLNLMTDGAEYLLALLKTSGNKTLYSTYKKTMTRTKECPSSIYIEQNFLAKMTTLCIGQNLSFSNINICELTEVFQTSKQTLDATIERTDKTYSDYLNAWSSYKGILLHIIAENYIPLYNTELVMCLPRFLDQQTQLKIHFIKERDDWRETHSSVPRLNLNLY